MDGLFRAKPPTPLRHMRQKGLRHRLRLCGPFHRREQRMIRTFAQVGLTRRDLIAVKAPGSIAPCG